MPLNDCSAPPGALDLGPLPDRRGIELLRQRFLALNAGRLERAHQLLSTRQQRVLHLLPLLFHVNHPGCPAMWRPALRRASATTNPRRRR